MLSVYQVALLSLAWVQACAALSLKAVDSCTMIAAEISDESAVFYPGDVQYSLDMAHFATSVQQNSSCSVQPGSAADVSIIMTIIADTRTPFAVKNGGHNLNAGFASTPGVQITMSRFKEVTYHPDSHTVDIGSGLIWDEVYSALEPHSVNVVGGRATGVGVTGLLLGGGYSYKTNQYGLGVDIITAIEIVVPSGEVRTVTHTSDEDLFFALRGGGNNFGVVTKFTLETHPQTDVWGGSITYSADQTQNVTDAVLKYTSQEDVKSAIQCTFATLQGDGLVMVNLFYDAPTAPTGLFDAFLAVPAVSSDIGTRSFISLFQSAKTDLTAGLRGIYTTVSHTAVTPTLALAMQNETKVYSNILGTQSLLLNGYVIEPFLPIAYQRGKSPTAFPPDRTSTIHPMNIYYAWTDPAADQAMLDAARSTATHLKDVARSEGILADASYPNYAMFDAHVEELFGANTGRLQRIRRAVDPHDVMGLTGGFRL